MPDHVSTSFAAGPAQDNNRVQIMDHRSSISALIQEYLPTPPAAGATAIDSRVQGVPASWTTMTNSGLYGYTPTDATNSQGNHPILESTHSLANHTTMAGSIPPSLTDSSLHGYTFVDMTDSDGNNPV